MGGGITIKFDGREVERLTVRLAGGPARFAREGRHALKRSAVIVDAAMVKDATGHMGNWFGIPGTSYVTPLPEHVSHELTGPLSADIGIENKGAGKLAHIIVHGSANNDPVYDFTAALRRSTPAIRRRFGEAAEQSVLGDS